VNEPQESRRGTRSPDQTCAWLHHQYPNISVRRLSAGGGDRFAPSGVRDVGNWKPTLAAFSLAILLLAAPHGAMAQARAATMGKDSKADAPAANRPAPAPGPVSTPASTYERIIRTPKTPPDFKPVEQIQKEALYEEQEQARLERVEQSRIAAQVAAEQRERMGQETRSKETYLQQNPLRLAQETTQSVDDTNHGFLGRASQLLEVAHNSIVKAADTRKEMSRPDLAGIGTENILNDGKDPPSRTLGDQLRNAAVKKISEAFSNGLQRQAQALQGAQAARGDSVVDADKDLDKAANPANLTKGLKTYMDDVTEKFKAYFNKGTDSILAPAGGSK